MDKNTGAKLKECSVDFCCETSTHGLSNMVRTDSRIIRLVWILLVLTGTGYCTYCKLVKFNFELISIVLP